MRIRQPQPRRRIQILGTDWNVYEIGLGLFRAERVILDPAFRALPTTVGGIIIAPAPGLGKYITPISVTFNAKILTAYSGVHADGYEWLGDETEGWTPLGYLYHAGGWSTYFMNYRSEGQAVWQQISGAYHIPTQTDGCVPFYVGKDEIENQPLSFRSENSTGNFGGGHANNKVKLSVVYTVDDLDF